MYNRQYPQLQHFASCRIFSKTTVSDRIGHIPQKGPCKPGLMVGMVKSRQSVDLSINVYLIKVSVKVIFQRIKDGTFRIRLLVYFVLAWFLNLIFVIN